MYHRVFLAYSILWIPGFLYNWNLKEAGLWSNLVVSLNVVMTIIIGGVSVGGAARSMVWLFGWMAFIFNLAEAIAGDVMDMLILIFPMWAMRVMYISATLGLAAFSPSRLLKGAVGWDRLKQTIIVLKI